MQAINGARKFEGPFLILGMVPHWPRELERRQGFRGRHTDLSALFPIQAIGAVPFAAGSPAKVTPALPDLVRPGPWAKRVAEYARRVTDDECVALMRFLDRGGRAKTAHQIARGLHISRPQVDVWLRGLQNAVGAALRVSEAKGRRGRAVKTFRVEHDLKRN